MKSNLCHYNNAYIIVRGDIIILGRNQTSEVASKNCAPFIKCITKMDRTTIGDAEDLELVISIYNLIEYSSNYSDTTGSLWFYLKNEAADFNADILTMIILNLSVTKLLGKALVDELNGVLRNTTFAMPLKYLSNFSRLFKIPFIN